MTAAFRIIHASNEQEAVNKIGTFLTSVVGWQVAQDVTDSGIDRDIVFRSTGEPRVPNTQPRYIRLRGTSNVIRLYTYETFVNTSVFTGELTESSFGVITASATTMIIRVVADLERVIIHVESSATNRFMGYVGRIDSYYGQHSHPYPNLIKGAVATTDDWYHEATEHNMWMLDKNGTRKHYLPAPVYDSSTLAAAAKSIRRQFGSEVFFGFTIARTGDSIFNECPGEPRGLYEVPPTFAHHGEIMKVGSFYYVVLEMNGRYWACGPVGLLSPSFVSV